MPLKPANKTFFRGIAGRVMSSLPSALIPASVTAAPAPVSLLPQRWLILLPAVACVLVVGMIVVVFAMPLALLLVSVLVAVVV